MPTCLLTGGAGFIGSHLARALVERGDTVRALDNLSSGRRENLEGLPVELIIADLLDPDAVRRAARGVDAIYHMAAMISVPGSMEDPAGAYRANVLGSLHVLEAARREGVRRVVLSSSCAVYGDAPGPVTEESPTRPLSPYAASKLAMEDLARLYGGLYHLETVCLRYFNVYGPRQDPASPYAAVIPIFLQAFLAGEPPTVHGDGEQSRDFIYVDDVVQANLLASQAARAAGQVFNIGTGTSASLNELIAAMRGLLPGAPAPDYGPARAGDIRTSQGGIARASRALGYRPAWDLHRGLQATVEWMRSRKPA